VERFVLICLGGAIGTGLRYLASGLAARWLGADFPYGTLIVNVVGSSIAREADGGIYLHAGPEIGVASTKAFTAQLMVLACLAIAAARARGAIDAAEEQRLSQALTEVPSRAAEVLNHDERIRDIAEIVHGRLGSIGSKRSPSHAPPKHGEHLEDEHVWSGAAPLPGEQLFDFSRDAVAE